AAAARKSQTRPSPGSAARQRGPIRLKLRTGPVPHGAAPSSCLLAIADVAEVAQILDRRRGLELAGVRELPLDAPMRPTLGGGIEEGTLQRRHRAIDGTLAPARHPSKGILGRSTKGGARRR